MKCFDAIIDDPNMCTHHAHMHSRATLLPDSDIFLSIGPLSQSRSCLSKSRTKAIDQGTMEGRWLAGKRTYPCLECGATPGVSELTIEDTAVLALAVGGFGYRDASSTVPSRLVSFCIDANTEFATHQTFTPQK